jgi:hypothetical protein
VARSVADHVGFGCVATKNGGIDAQTPALRKKWFTQMLGMFEPGRLIDLGSGHGDFAVMAADLGWIVTALDARGDRYPDDEPRVDWQVGDVRDADLGGYDVIACLGLFYHLTVDDQLELLARCAGTPLILDTHVANGGRSPFVLSKVVSRRGYRGQLYREPDRATRSTRSTASWGNDDSFWPRPQAMYRMLDEHGYDAMAAVPWYLPTRTFWLCLPRGSEPDAA